MRITIKTKLFLVFGSIITLLILLIVVLNSLFLDDFYLLKNESTFYSTFKTIQTAYKQDNSIIDFINVIDRQEGISTIITDSKRAILYNSYQKEKDAKSEKLPKEIESFLVDHLDDIQNKYAYGSTVKLEGEIPKVTFIAKSSQGDLIILTKPMKGISDSVAISNQFTILIGLFIVGVGSILMSILSNKLTKPIRAMNDVTKEISNLDFSRRVNNPSHDELGDLGNNINTIAVKLNDSVQSLKSDIERRKQLARDMSHELKTPISAIKGYAEGLTHGLADSQTRIDKYCNVIVSECDRMDLIVKQLLDLSILEDSSTHLELSKFKLDGLFEKLKDDYLDYVNENGFELIIEKDPSITVNADLQLLEKAIGNYIVNAVRYGSSPKIIKIYPTVTEKSIMIKVFNTGDSINQVELEKIFNMFYKVDKARSRDQGGHGLGLAIVKQIAELHGGKAYANNTETGVEFIFELNS